MPKPSKLKFPKRIQLAGQRPTVKELDDLCREIVRKRDKTCRRCGKDKNLQVAHVYSRAKRSVRWDLDNLFLLCPHCHMNFAHKDPIGFSGWVQRQLGDAVFGLLIMRANIVSKTDRQLVKIYLEQALRRLGG